MHTRLKETNAFQSEEKNIRNHFSSLCDNSSVPTKQFWDLVKPFLNDKGSHGNENYTLLEKGRLIKDHRQISEIFDDHYINIIENITGEKQEELHSDSLRNKNQTEKKEILSGILEKYSGHPSILNIKQHFSSTGRNLFQFQKAEPSDILKIIQGMKSNTSVGVDKIPPKLVIMSAEVIAEPLTDLINNTMLDHLIFPSVEKEASVTPAFKKEDRQFKENYRPISVLNVFSKIFERFLLNQMLPFIDN